MRITYTRSILDNVPTELSRKQAADKLRDWRGRVAAARLVSHVGVEVQIRHPKGSTEWRAYRLFQSGPGGMALGPTILIRLAA